MAIIIDGATITGGATFTGVASPVAPSTVEYLVVAGGGSGSGNGGGGGGAGGLLTNAAYSVTGATSYTVTVGAGGPYSTFQGSSGSPSVFGTGTVTNSAATSGTITALGGGAGGAGNSANGASGGSGGGGGRITVTGGSATTGQGSAGGSGINDIFGAAGGGGGAGGVGSTGTGVASTGGAGGAGLPSSITGTSTFYAGGGGGGGGDTAGGGAGGSGIGGNGGGGSGTIGTDNRGGGGGGGNNSTPPYNGARGGSGVVIIAYPDNYAEISSITGLTYSVSTTSRTGYRVYTFTAGTGTITWAGEATTTTTTAAPTTTTTTAAPTPTDASFAYVPLLTETGSVSMAATTVADGAQTPNTVTRNGGVSTGWTSPYQTDGYWSNYFNGSSTLNLATNAIPASGAFTFETFVYATGTSASQVIAAQYPNGTASGRFMILWNDTANKFTVVLGASTVFVSDATYSANTWLYLVVQRDASNVWSMYVNGTRNTATVSSATAIDTAVTYIGNRNTGGTPYTGYISNLRVVSSALYSGSTISVPTTPFSVSTTNQVLLTCYSNRFIDANTATTAKVITVTGTPSVQSGYYPFAAPTASPGAALLNGTNQYLSVPNNAVFNMGGNDFTIECWYYPLVSTPSNSIYAKRATTAVYGSVQLGFAGALTPAILATFDNATWGINITSSIACVSNSWNHLAFSRSGSSWRLFVNGSLGASTTSASSVATNSSAVTIGAAAADGGGILSNGYISNFRFVNGNAVYTSAFTLPTAPLAATQSANSNGNPSAAITGTQTSLLLGLADSNYTSASSGGTNNTFIDDSTNAFTITRNGTPTQGSRTPYWPNGQWSNYFGASGDYISVPDAANLELSNSDFQMDAWVYLTAYPASNLGSYASAILAKGNFAGTRSYEFLINGASGTSLGVALTNAGATTTNITGSFSFALNTWYAVRATRVSNRVYLFVNGTLLNAGGTAYTDTVSNGTDALKVGRANLDVNYVFQLFGYVSNVSLAISGTGYSTASYTPSTVPLTAGSDTRFLSCQSNRFKDNSNTPAVVSVAGTPSVQAFQPFSPAASYSAATYAGSGYFSASNYISVAANASLASNTNSFTLEFWYNSTVTGNGRPAGSGGSSFTTNTWVCAANNTAGKLEFFVYNYSSSVAMFSSTSSTVASDGAWHHIVLVRSTNTWAMFIDGTRQGSSVTSSVSFNGTSSSLAVGFSGIAGDTATAFVGYISNFRFVNGVAIYDPAQTTISVPTTPVTNTAQTSLLLNMANAGIYDAAAQNNITTVSAAQVSTAQSQWPSSSILFNGGTSSLSIPSSTAFGLGTGDWTIEFWVYLNAAPPTNITLVSMLTNISGAGFAPHIYCVTGGGLRYYTNSSDRITGGVLASGTWNYVAVSKASGSTKMYINGTQTGSTYTDSNNYGTSNPFAVADYAVPLAGGTVNGYFQDVRITKGVGRTITASPTTAFPTQ